MVKDLREATGAGMMDCKAALDENKGDMEAAIDWLRKKGIAKAAKKASRVASEGLTIAVAQGNKGAVVEVNSETDFVAKNPDFRAFVEGLAQLVLSSGITDVEALKTQKMAETLTNLIAKIGENMNIRRAQILSVPQGAVSAYVHGAGKIGVLVAVKTASADAKVAETARNVAMHVAAANPLFLDSSSVDGAALEREKAVFADQARQGGKPEAIIAKIVDGRVAKYYEEVCLVEQPFVMDQDRKVKDVIKGAAADATVAAFVRFQLGEGIEKQVSDFAAEVAAAVNG
jgi:elongation factor Ts